MKYILYTKRVENVQDELERNWLMIGTNMSLDSIASMLDTLTEDPNNDDYVYAILPDLGEGDIVINMKNNEMAKVIHLNYPESEIEFVTVKTENGSVLTWPIKNLMVMG